MAATFLSATKYADIGRALSDSNSVFLNQAGDEFSRRAAQRYYDILYDREPDNGGYYYWDASCNLTYMKDMAFNFSVTNKAELVTRLPIPSGNSSTARVNSRKRVQSLYWAFNDKNASGGDLNYWAYNYSTGSGYIYGSHSSSSSAREDRYNWLAWQTVVNTSWAFHTQRNYSTGTLGAPPMCSSGW